MKRLATSIATAAWIGFLGVFCIELLADVAVPDLATSLSVASWPPELTAQFDGIGPVLEALGTPAKLGMAAVCLGLVALFASALYLLNTPRGDDPAKAEKRLGSALVSVALLALAAQISGQPLLPIDLGGGLVWLAVTLSVIAVLFDRLVDTQETDDEAEFHAGITAMAERMARQTRLYTQPDTSRGD
jgi:hypothetical protein